MKIDILGVQVNADTKNTIIFLVKKLLVEKQKIFIATPYSEMIVRAQKDRRFRDILNSATFVLPDGIGILWSAKYLQLTTYNRLLNLWYLVVSLGSIIFHPKYIHSPITEKISGSDFIWDLAKIAEERGYSIFLLGGYGDTPKLAADKLKSRFRNLQIAGIYSPPREEGIGEVIIQQINSAHPDFLFVALGPVAQEKWIAENLPKLNVKLAIGLGGTFDYLAEKRAPAPQIWRRTGLEWLWRLLTQPWRIWRIAKGVLGLIYYVFRAKV